jgi:hypothetical protein
MTQNFKNKDERAKVENSPLPSFIANNIRTTHFSIGPGGQAGPTEVQARFQNGQKT